MKVKNILARTVELYLPKYSKVTISIKVVRIIPRKNIPPFMSRFL